MRTIITVPTGHKPYWKQTEYSNENLHPLCKMLRNYIVCCDLGFKHFNLDTWCYGDNKATSKERYLDWVKGWKENYQSLTLLIRELKNQRVKEYYRKIYEDKRYGDIRSFKRMIRIFKCVFDDKKEVETDFETAYSANFYRCEEAIRELRRAAQQMMNARYNMKMASIGIKARTKTNMLVS